MSHERPVLRPSVYKTVTRSGRDEGYEIEFEKINRFGERASSLAVSELSLADLGTLYAALGTFLDECEDYQVG
jgi:hypothetical protein